MIRITILAFSEPNFRLMGIIKAMISRNTGKNIRSERIVSQNSKEIFLMLRVMNCRTTEAAQNAKSPKKEKAYLA